MTTLADMLDAAMAKEGLSQTIAPPNPLDIQARILRDLLPEMQRPNPFQVGDLVEQIEHLTAYKPLRQRMVDELAEMHMEDVYRHQRKLDGPGPHPTRGFRRQPVRMGE